MGALLATAGCSDDAASKPDAARMDLRVTDLTTDQRVAADTKLAEASAGDSGHPDAGHGNPEAGSPDAGAACPVAFAGCTTFVDATAASANRTIVYRDFAYDPACLRVQAGQSVTFEGATATDNFLRHPLVQSCGPQADVLVAKQGKTATLTLTTAGLYGYYCLDHGNAVGQVMSGAIEVVP